jgi:splicing factor 1
MARDCPDRQRGTNWRSDDRGGAPAGGRPAGRVGDAVDREYESLMQELSGGASGAGPQHRIEAGPGDSSGGGYDANGGGAAASSSTLPPWQQRSAGGGGSGSAAPWARNREERDTGAGGGSVPPWAAGRATDQYSYGAQGGYGAPPPPPSGGQNYGYDYSGYGGAPGSFGAPPGIPPAPPGMPSYYTGVANPPPPPPGDAPPPPVRKTVIGIENDSYKFQPPADAPPPPPPGM